MNDRIYKVEIVAYPLLACVTYRRLPEHLEGSTVQTVPAADNAILSHLFVPDGWNEAVEGKFYWPSTRRLYRSRSAAVTRKALIESYGATARVLVTETEWVEERESVRRRRVARAITRANRLNDKAAAIIAEALATTEEDAA